MWWAVSAFFDVVTMSTVPASLAAVVGTWKDWFKGIGAFLGSAAAAVFWTLIGRHLICWLEWWFCGAMGLAVRYVLPLITAALKVLPAFPQFPLEAGSAIRNGWLTANYVFPVNECVLGAFLMSLVILTIRVARFVKQFFPTVSN